MAYSKDRYAMMEQRVLNYLNDLQDDFEKIKEDFVKDFQQSPSNAIHWSAPRVVEGEALRNVARDILKLMEGHSFLSAIRDRIAYLRDFKIRFFSMSSSSLYSNAESYHEIQAYLKFIERIEGYVNYLQDMIDEAHEEVSLSQGATDVTKYALRATKIQLLTKLEECHTNADLAKTKKDAHAANVAAEAIRRSLVDLEKLAEDLGVNVG